MKALQIIFLISFALFVLLVPYLIFNLLQGEDTTPLIIFLAVIFAVNCFFIIRKIVSSKKKQL